MDVMVRNDNSQLFQNDVLAIFTFNKTYMSYYDFSFFISKVKEDMILLIIDVFPLKMSAVIPVK